MLVEVERQGAVARVWFNRPETHNALSSDLGAALVTALDALATDSTCRVVVLGGRGPSFCAGADIAAMKASAEARLRGESRGSETLRLLVRGGRGISEAGGGAPPRRRLWRRRRPVLRV